MFSSTDSQAAFDEFEAYPFSSDPDFKAGLPTVLSAIRGKERTPSQIDEMISRAQWFYFTRIKRITLPWEAYAQHSQSQIHHLQHRSTSTSTSASSSAMTPMSPSSSTSTSSPLTTIQRNPSNESGKNYEESRRMMGVGGNLDHAVDLSLTSTSQNKAEVGMSFDMLCRLISEGRASEVEVKQIPDELNKQRPSESMMRPRTKPWESEPARPSSSSAGSMQSKREDDLQQTLMPEYGSSNWDPSPGP